MTGLSQSDAGVASYNGVITIIPPNQSGTLTAAITASRSSGVSPCTVAFSCDATTDTVRDSHEVWRELGYYFDFNDPTSGNFTTTKGGSKNIAVGGPMAAHTFVVADGGGSQEFTVIVTVKNPEGDEAQASVVITVQAQDDYYSAANTICVSTTLDPGTESQWTTGHTERNCPAGATYQNTLPAWNACDGKRILLRKGEDFSAIVQDVAGDTGDFVIRYGQSDVMFSFFGDTADTKPEMQSFYLGGETSTLTQPFVYTAANFSTFGGWNERVTLDSLKMFHVQTPKSFKHFDMYNLDMDSSAEATSGKVKIAGSNFYDATDPGPANVIYPYGLYMSECVLHGSTTDDTGTNTNFFSSGETPVLFAGIIGCSFDYAVEHNFRTMGAQKWVIHNSDFLGNHGVGSKHRVVIRARGYNQVILQEDDTQDSVGQTSDSYVQSIMSSHNVIQDCTFSVGTRNTDETLGITHSSWDVQMAQDDAALALPQDGIIRNNNEVTTVDTNANIRWIAVGGRWITEGENTVDDGATDNDAFIDIGSTKDLDAIDLGLGTPSLTPNYGSASATPVPTAPR